MNEEKAAAYRREKERKEKSLRKEAYIMHLQEEEKQRIQHKQEVIDKLVIISLHITQILSDRPTLSCLLSRF